VRFNAQRGILLAFVEQTITHHRSVFVPKPAASGGDWRRIDDQLSACGEGGAIDYQGQPVRAFKALIKA
jgi:hypothetical protein